MAEAARPVGFPGHRGRLRLLTLVAAASAGLGAWAIGEPLHAYFQPPLRRVVTMGYISFRPTDADALAAKVKNASVAYGLLGALNGLLLGVAGGLSRRDPRAAAIAGGVGLIAGAVLTVAVAVPAVIGYWAYFGDDALSSDLLVPWLTHAASWSAVGVAGGLALGLGAGAGRSGMIRTALGGLFGAVVGAVVYELAGAILFPLDKTTLPVSESSSTRLLARLSVAIGVAIFALPSLVAAARGRLAIDPLHTVEAPNAGGP